MELFQLENFLKKKKKITVLRNIGAQRANASKELLSRSQARNDLLTELNIALMRSQARMMVSRICVPDPTDPNGSDIGRGDTNCRSGCRSMPTGSTLTPSPPGLGTPSEVRQGLGTLFPPRRPASCSATVPLSAQAHCLRPLVQQEKG